jgi:hypothetical protein
VRDLSKRPEDTLTPEPDEPPIVARLVVEIRSDGSRTIARGAMEDLTTGERVAVNVKGTTPLALARSLAQSMFRVPSLARAAAEALLGRGKPRE